jgi:hypothetical protein
VLCSTITACAVRAGKLFTFVAYVIQGVGQTQLTSEECAVSGYSSVRYRTLCSVTVTGPKRSSGEIRSIIAIPC